MIVTIVEDMTTTSKTFHHNGSRLRATENFNYADVCVDQLVSAMRVLES